jgi:hypothetical protein
MPQSSGSKTAGTDASGSSGMSLGTVSCCVGCETLGVCIESFSGDEERGGYRVAADLVEDATDDVGDRGV